MQLGSIIANRGPGKLQQEVTMATRLAGVALLVLLIASANVINLLLARAVRRRREIAVRLALGISRARLATLLAAETMLLALGAAIAALVVGVWGGSLLRSRLLPNIRWDEPVLDWRVVAFTLAVAVLAGAIASIVPAIQSSRPRMTDTLKAGSRDGVVHRSRLRVLLVTGQAALSVVLLVGALLFVRSLRNVEGIRIGYDADQLILASAFFYDVPAPSTSDETARLHAIADRLRSAPGVERVAFTSQEPMRAFSFTTFYTDRDSSQHLGRNAPTLTGVSAGFFAAAGTRILRGSGFPAGAGSAMPPLVVVNEAAARVMWPGREAIGQCVWFGSRDKPCFRVTGVVENTPRSGVLEQDHPPMMYVSTENPPEPDVFGTNVIVIRAGVDAVANVIGETTRALRRQFPGAEPRVRTMAEYLAPQYRPWKLGATLFTAFGVLALIVAAIGIYSTVAYSVSQRTHEFGVRIALGARMLDVVRRMVSENLWIVSAGVGIGLVLAVLGGRLIRSLLYGVTPGDAATLATVAVGVIVIAVLAALVPAWRAARVDPVTALRAE